MKNPILLILLITTTVLQARKSNQPEGLKTNQVTQTAFSKLELVWETNSTLSTCESVLYDQTSSLIYVANINNDPWEKDNNGFISTMNTKGKVIDHKWVEGLNAPKGIGILNGKLYVNDIDEIVEIDIAKKAIIKRCYVEGEPALNEITISKDGIIYASGSSSNSIYSLHNDILKPVATLDYGRLNGLLDRPEGIYYASSGSSEFGLFDKNEITKKVLVDGIGMEMV